jgi:ubiquinone/menaquinone biosynthesis C-methylase UbiE
MQTIEIAKLSHGLVTAVDNYQPYLEELKKTAANEGVGERIKTVNADMDHLGFEDKSFFWRIKGILRFLSFAG